MKKFIIEDDFWSLFPDARIGIVICKNIANTLRGQEAYEAMLGDAEKEALKYLQEPEFSNNEIIKVWREAFQKFKTKKGARSSIEALMKRVSKGNHIGTINPLVDIYNATSLRYGLPCGGEDIDTFRGDIRLTKALGDESFITLGTNESAPPYEGEIVYKDDEGAICRCWNWRESVRTMLAESTKNAFLCIELVDPQREEALRNALEYLAKTVEAHLGGICEISVVDIYHKSIAVM